MRGRRPAGPGFVDKLAGEEAAKERLKIVLETIAGQRRVTDACAALGLSEQRFDELRLEALQAAVAALTPKTPGRKPRLESPEAEAIARLEARVADLEAQLRVAAEVAYQDDFVHASHREAILHRQRFAGATGGRPSSFCLASVASPLSL